MLHTVWARRLSGSSVLHALTFLILVEFGIAAMRSVTIIFILSQLLALAAAHTASLYVQVAARAYASKHIASAQYQLFVHLPCGSTTTFLGDQESSVEDLINFIGANETAVSLQSQSGILLNDPKRILVECVSSGSTVHVLPRMRGGGAKRTRIPENIDGEKAWSCGSGYGAAAGTTGATLPGLSPFTPRYCIQPPALTRR
jgi:hypothetical protein